MASPLTWSSSSSSCHSRCASRLPLLTSIKSSFSARSVSLSDSRKRSPGRCSRSPRIQQWFVAAVSGVTSSAQYAKEMERIAAKEALLLAIKDHGGFLPLNNGSENNAGSIDINERILALERLNPTPRPTTSPLLDGLWEFEWASSQSPASTAVKYFTMVLPSTLASINAMKLLILDGSAKATAMFKLLGMIDSSFTLTAKLTVEGPIRLREEYVEGLLTTPTIPENAVPSQLKGVYDQLISASQRLPDTLTEALSGGLKIPLTTAGTFQRQLLISYLDDEILISRDVSGAPDVLLRTGGVAVASAESLPEYVS